MMKSLDEMKDEVRAAKKALVLLEGQRHRKECTEEEFLRWREQPLGTIEALQWASGVQEEVPIQRTEEAVRERMAQSEQEMSALRGQYRRKDIEKVSFLRMRERKMGVIQTLRWVLGEQDRYD